MYHVTTVCLSPDVSRVDPAAEPADLGEISAPDLLALLERLRLLPAADSAEIQPHLVIVGRSGKFHVRAGNQRLFLYNARDTVEPYAKKTKRTLVERGQLTELSNKRRPLSTKKVVASLLGDSNSGLICTHRPALPSVLEPLANAASKDLKKHIMEATALKPGDFIVLRLTLGSKPKVASAELCNWTSLLEETQSNS